LLIATVMNTLVPVSSRFKKPANKIPGKGGLRWYKNVGLGFKTPREAMEGMSDV